MSATQTPEISVILPCHNEEENIAPLLEELRSAMTRVGRPWEVLFVDDASSDGTVTEVETAAADDQHVRLVRHKAKFGQSAAILSGYEAARGNYLLTMDADLQNDPADFGEFIAALDRGADCVCGVRRKRHDSWVKKKTSRIANAVRQWALHDGILDAGCAMRAVRRSAVRQLIGFRALHRFLPTILQLHGYRVEQIPINHRARVHGQSKYGTLDRLFVGISDLRGMRWYAKRFFPPDRIAVGDPARDSANHVQE